MGQPAIYWNATEGIAASVNHGLKKLGYEAGGLEDIRKTIGLSIYVLPGIWRSC